MFALWPFFPDFLSYVKISGLYFAGQYSPNLLVRLLCCIGVFFHQEYLLYIISFLSCSFGAPSGDYIKEKDINYDSHATAVHPPFLPRDNFWYIYLDIIESQKVGDGIGPLLAILPRESPEHLNKTVTRSMSLPQYKSIFNHLRSINELRFSISTENGKICDILELNFVLHFRKM